MFKLLLSHGCVSRVYVFGGVALIFTYASLANEPQLESTNGLVQEVAELKVKVSELSSRLDEYQKSKADKKEIYADLRAVASDVWVESEDWSAADSYKGAGEAPASAWSVAARRYSAHYLGGIATECFSGSAGAQGNKKAVLVIGIMPRSLRDKCDTITGAP